MILKSKIYEGKIFENIHISKIPKKKQVINRIKYCLDSESAKIYLFLSLRKRITFIKKFKEEVYNRKSCPSNILKYFSVNFPSIEHSHTISEKTTVVCTYNPELIDSLLNKNISFCSIWAIRDPRIYHYILSVAYIYHLRSLFYEGKYYRVN